MTRPAIRRWTRRQWMAWLGRPAAMCGLGALALRVGGGPPAEGLCAHCRRAAACPWPRRMAEASEPAADVPLCRFGSAVQPPREESA